MNIQEFIERVLIEKFDENIKPKLNLIDEEISQLKLKFAEKCAKIISDDFKSRLEWRLNNK